MTKRDMKKWKAKYKKHREEKSISKQIITSDNGSTFMNHNDLKAMVEAKGNTFHQLVLQDIEKEIQDDPHEQILDMGIYNDGAVLINKALKAYGVFVGRTGKDGSVQRVNTIESFPIFTLITENKKEGRYYAYTTPLFGHCEISSVLQKDSFYDSQPLFRLEAALTETNPYLYFDLVIRSLVAYLVKTQVINVRKTISLQLLDDTEAGFYHRGQNHFLETTLFGVITSSKKNKGQVKKKVNQIYDAVRSNESQPVLQTA